MPWLPALVGALCLVLGTSANDYWGRREKKYEIVTREGHYLWREPLGRRIWHNFLPSYWKAPLCHGARLHVNYDGSIHLDFQDVSLPDNERVFFFNGHYKHQSILYIRYGTTNHERIVVGPRPSRKMQFDIPDYYFALKYMFKVPEDTMCKVTVDPYDYAIPIYKRKHLCYFWFPCYMKNGIRVDRFDPYSWN